MTTSPRVLRIALAQINPTAGKLRANAAMIINSCKKAIERGQTLIIFPELSLSAYPPRDLLDRPDFIIEQMEMLHMIARTIPPSITAIIGCATPRKNDA